ncbi:MAG: pseudouridine synthase [Saprospiraceae bacterium]|nr:pseudouridine synthase [Saprospiraceae bacterium]
MVSQFISSHNVRLLGDLQYPFPEGTHAIGRLDKESEGLLLLTTNKKVTKLLFQGPIPHERTYLVQVSHSITDENLEKIRKGVTIEIKGGLAYATAECKVEKITNPVSVYPLAINQNAYEPVTWLTITITEGKFHQVRKMTNAVRHKCKRLIRISIEDLSLDNLQPGEVMEIEEELFFTKLKIKNWK